MKNHLNLNPDELHVWLFCYHQLPNVKVLDAFISEAERLRSSRYKFEGLQQRYLQTRALLRYVLSCYTKIKPLDIIFSEKVNGKPIVKKSHIHFNISHTETVLAIGVAEFEVGVDVEQPHAQLDLTSLAHMLFDEQESRTFAGLTGEKARIDFFLRCWTEKEAFIKATGKGLSLEFSQFFLRPLTERKSCVHCSDRTIMPSTWYTQYLGVYAKNHMSICYPVSFQRIKFIEPNGFEDDICGEIIRSVKCYHSLPLTL